MPVTETTTRNVTRRFLHRCKRCGVTRRTVHQVVLRRTSGDHLGKLWSRVVDVSCEPREAAMPCPTCARQMERSQVAGHYHADIPCTAKCVAAVGPNCDCSCAGANHGGAHG